MATNSQIDANRLNAQFSTGPRTESGKATSSRNALTLGLYTRADYVKPEERDLYKEFCETMYAELCPASLLEETLVSEITGASWRLRRCNAADAGLDFFDESTDKLRRSVERARASATSLLHRGINQLRRLQTDRRKSAPPAPALQMPQPQPQPLTKADLESLLEPPADFIANLDAMLTRQAGNFAPGQMASICQTAFAPAPPARQIPRSAPCPCKSGEKYKRCCGKNAPPVLHAA